MFISQAVVRITDFPHKSVCIRLVRLNLSFPTRFLVRTATGRRSKLSLHDAPGEACSCDGLDLSWHTTTRLDITCGWQKRVVIGPSGTISSPVAIVSCHFTRNRTEAELMGCRQPCGHGFRDKTFDQSLHYYVQPSPTNPSVVGYNRCLLVDNTQ